MLEKINQAIASQQPVDIYFRISVDNQPSKCMLYYPAFIIVKIDIPNKTFLGYTLENRHKKPNDKILTEDNIELICEIKGLE